MSDKELTMLSYVGDALVHRPKHWRLTLEAAWTTAETQEYREALDTLSMAFKLLDGILGWSAK